VTAELVQPEPTLADCEAVIERGLTTFVEVGEALATIRDARLYKDTHGTFEDYCRERWGFSRRHSNRLIEAAEVVGILGPIGPTVTNEGQARALGQVVRDLGADAAAEVLEQVAATGIVTATRITEAAQQRNPITAEMRQAADDVMGPLILDGPTSKHRIASNSGNMEWYTPAHILDAARALFFDEYCPESLDHADEGCDCPPITTDPATSDIAQQGIGAKYWWTAETDGLAHEWHGNVWLNPPYSQPLLSDFVRKLLGELDAGRVRQALVLTNNATETRWAQELLDAATAVCFLRGRLRYLNTELKEENSSLQGQMVVYFAGDAGLDFSAEQSVAAFTEAFGGLGRVMR
jgi:hypothetical protein